MSNYVMEYWVEPMTVLEMVMNEYVELTPYQVLFEADTPDVSDQMKKNANLEKQSDNAIMKIIKGITGLIGRIIQTITDFFRKLFMNGDEKRAFDEMQEMIRKNPNIKNKKLTIKDFKKLNAEFNQINNDAQNAINSIHAGKETATTDLLNRMQNFIEGGVVPGSAIVLTTVAVNAARDDAGVAKLILNKLNDESAIMKKLEESLGKKDAQKFKKEIDRCTRELILHRKLVNVFGKHYNSLQENILDTTANVNNLLHGKLTLSNVGLFMKALGNKKIRNQILKPEAKRRIKNQVDQTRHDIYTKVNGEPERPDALNYITGGKVKQADIEDKVAGAIHKVGDKVFGKK